jgi:hypothetical protein
VPEPQPILTLEPAALEPAAGARLEDRETGRPDEPQWLRAAVELPDARRLETSVFQDGHWSVFADSRRLPPEPGDGPFVAARLPAGTRKVDLVYRPGSFVLGCVLAALGLALTTLIAVPRPAGACPREALSDT